MRGRVPRPPRTTVAFLGCGCCAGELRGAPSMERAAMIPSRVPFFARVLVMVRPYAALLVAVCLTASAAPAAAATGTDPPRASYATRADVRAFIGEMADEYG